MIRLTQEVLGADQNNLKARSPNHLAGPIKASESRSADSRDPRAPAARAVVRYDALKAAGEPVRAAGAR